MSEIVKTFGNSNFHITKEGDTIWWWGNEVAEALGYALPRKAIRCHVRDDEKRLANRSSGAMSNQGEPQNGAGVLELLLPRPPSGGVPNQGGFQNGTGVLERLLPRNATKVDLSAISSDDGTSTYQINECGLYRLIFSSKLPKAEEFKTWVFTEVLPSIRKTGGYAKFVTRHNQLCIRNETDLHYEVVKEIRKRFPNFVLTVPGGEMQDTAEKRIDMYKKGFKVGMPDIMIMNPHRFYNGMCIELKTPGGTGILSDKQRD